MIGYKICRNADHNKFALVTLEIPDCATVVRPLDSNKLRCDMAKVQDVREIRCGILHPFVVTEKKLDRVYSMHVYHIHLGYLKRFEYKLGEFVTPEEELNKD